MTDDQWKQDAPELNFESHSKGSEFLCKEGISVFNKKLWGIVCRLMRGKIIS